jgi:hypothetical protein
MAGVLKVERVLQRYRLGSKLVGANIMYRYPEWSLLCRAELPVSSIVGNLRSLAAYHLHRQNPVIAVLVADLVDGAGIDTEN